MSSSLSNPTESDAERFLLATLTTMRRTVAMQVANAVRSFERGDEPLARSVQVKDGYVNNLNTQMQELAPRVGAEGNPPLARCAWTMASHFEHIGDYAVNVAGQVAFRIGDQPPPGTHPLRAYQALVIRGTAHALRAVRERSFEAAFATCRLEEDLDRLYAEDLVCVGQALERGGLAARAALTWAFVVKNLERMGDMLLNLGEAVLSMLCGEKMKLSHLQTIEHLLPRAQLRVKGVWGGRSGAFVGIVERDGEALVYKGGAREKILREHDNLRLWEALTNDIAPEVVQPPGSGDPTSMLVERIEGPTFEDVVFQTERELAPVLTLLFHTMEPIWNATRRPTQTPTDFVSQIRGRLRALFDIHPGLERVRAVPLALGPLAFPDLESLLALAGKKQAALPPAPEVFLHGDLNLSNLVLAGKGDEELESLEGRRVRVVDVFRTHRGDLAQDISVLMVSCLRHPMATGPAAERARWFYEAIRARATAYAERNGDAHFGERLKLGLARSYITSGRVVRDPRLALRLFLKGVWYLEDFVCLRSEW